MSVQFLDADKVSKTITKLVERIEERFPNSGLLRVCKQLDEISDHTKERSAAISRPIIWTKVVVWGLIVTTFVLCVILPFVLDSGFTEEDMTWKSLLEMGDPVFNEVVVIGAGFFFMFTLENRIKRNRALKAIHELRSIAHVIDMHQLTKDPERVLMDRAYTTTEHSPKAEMDSFMLRRYLDYCTEMLSLTSKLAAVYIRDFDDEVALAAVNEVESLTTGLSSKIWQKIMILYSAEKDQPQVSLPENVRESTKPSERDK